MIPSDVEMEAELRKYRLDQPNLQRANHLRDALNAYTAFWVKYLNNVWGMSITAEDFPSVPAPYLGPYIK